MTTDVCPGTQEAAIRDSGYPGSVHTNQGSQFTSTALVDLVQQHGIQLSMDGKSSWCDNLFVPRLWKSVKYEEVYVPASDSVREAQRGLAAYFALYNSGPPSALDGRTRIWSTSACSPSKGATSHAPSRGSFNAARFLSNAVGPPSKEFVGTLLERVMAAPLPPGLEREIVVADDRSTGSPVEGVKTVVAR